MKSDSNPGELKSGELLKFAEHMESHWIVRGAVVGGRSGPMPRSCIRRQLFFRSSARLEEWAVRRSEHIARGRRTSWCATHPKAALQIGIGRPGITLPRPTVTLLATPS
jgi:hypothetical protein